MEMSCERFPTGGNFSSYVELEHREGYRHAAAFVNGADLIDIACGSGYGNRLLAEANARSVRGFFVDSSAAEYATEHFAIGHLYFAQGDAENLVDVPDNSADVLVFFETIEHLNRVHSYLREMRRILRPGRQYFVSTPNRCPASMMYLLRDGPANGYRIEEFRGGQLRRMLEVAGFEMAEFGGQNYIHDALMFWPPQVFIKRSGYALRLGGVRGYATLTTSAAASQ